MKNGSPSQLAGYTGRALDLTFASYIPPGRVANVKSTPRVRAIDIEERIAMQKEKQSFEGIPNCGKTIQFIPNCLIAVNQAA
jgi:hypothetical protein